MLRFEQSFCLSLRSSWDNNSPGHHAPLSVPFSIYSMKWTIRLAPWAMRHSRTQYFTSTHTQKTHWCFCKNSMTTHKVDTEFSSASLNFFDRFQRIVGLLSDLAWRQRSNKMFEVSIHLISSTKSDLGLVRLNSSLTAQLFLWKPSVLGQMA